MIEHFVRQALKDRVCCTVVFAALLHGRRKRRIPLTAQPSRPRMDERALVKPAPAEAPGWQGTIRLEHPGMDLVLEEIQRLLALWSLKCQPGYD